MAYGGMRTQHPRIGERSVAGQRLPPGLPGLPDAAPAPGLPGGGDPSPQRSRVEPPVHCWVTQRAGRGEADGARAPGVLVEWQHEGGRWWGLVVFVVVEDGRRTVVTRPVPAEDLAPA